MRRIKADYKEYMEWMKRKDYVITDAPWNLNDKPPKVARQLDYELWKSDIAGMISIFENVRTDLLFVWVINAIIQEMFEALFIYNWTQPDKSLHWRNKNKWCWRKMTNLGNEFYGTGWWNRNASEELFIFSRSSCKPIGLSLKSHFPEMRKDKTVKPKLWEAVLLSKLEAANKRSGAYLFSGTDPDLSLFNTFDIDCVDIDFNKQNTPKETILTIR